MKHHPHGPSALDRYRQAEYQCRMVQRLCMVYEAARDEAYKRACQPGTDDHGVIYPHTNAAFVAAASNEARPIVQGMVIALEPILSETDCPAPPTKQEKN